MRGLKRLGLWTSALFMVFASGKAALALEVEVSSAPENDLALTVGAIRSARSSLLVNIYELSSADVANAILEQVHSGVQVEIIEEGQPVGGMSTASKGIQSQIVQAMRQSQVADHFYEMASGGGKKRRYRFDHAKYAVIDGSRLLIGSENYSPSGNPVPGSLGNRGWEVLIDDPGLAKKFEGVFREDSDTSFGDVLDLVSRGVKADSKKPSPGASPSLPHSPVSSGGRRLSADSVSDVFSPDNSESSLLGLLRSARTSIDVEQMTLDSSWKGAARSPLVDELVAAAERGVAVRVLLNDDRVFAHPGHPFNDKNKATVDLLSEIASQKRVSLSARVANLKAMGVDYIHNKGALVDGHLTLISSINWDRNSITHNRESAVVIDSSSVNSYYEALYEHDWTVSEGAAAGVPVAVDPSQQPPVLFPDRAAQRTLTCPQRIRLEVAISPLRLDDAEDQDFQFLSGRRWAETLVRDPDGKGCVLVASGNSTGVQDRMFFEIKKSALGQNYFSLEGYTPRAMKLYSIRASGFSTQEIGGTHRATVYDGSGPSREKLGEAVVIVEELEK